MMIPLIKDFLHSFKRDRRGSVTVEFGLVLTAIATLGIAITEFGLAFTRKAELANAARAGMQFAIVVPPFDDFDDPGDEFIEIEEAVAEASPSTSNASNRQIRVTLTCECPNTGTAVVCADTPEDACGVGVLRAAFVTVTISETYQPIFGFLPGFEEGITLSASAVGRLS